MHATATRHLRRNRLALLIFGLIATGVYGTCLALSRRLPALDAAGAVAAGMTLDMMLVVPAAFYLLVVRRRNLPATALIPVLVLSFLAAAWILPDDHETLLGLFEMMAVPLEMAVLGWIAWRATRAVGAARRGPAGADPLERFHRAALELTGHERAASVLATELAVFAYAFRRRRAEPHVPPGFQAFTHHRKSAHGIILLVLAPILAGETFALHVLLSLWSPAVAWVLTALSLYTGLWLLADFRATVLRPILISGDTVRLRAGLRWSLEVPRSAVRSVTTAGPGAGKAGLALTLVTSPTHWVALSDPVTATGPYGLRKRVIAVGVCPDDPGAFTTALQRPPDAQSGSGGEPA